MLFAVGFAAGFNFQDTTAGEVVLGIVLLLLLGYAFSWIFALVGLYSSSPETANSIGFTAIFPLTFASSIFVPAETMPDGLQQFAEANPFTTISDAVRLAVDRHAGQHRRVDGVHLVRRADRGLRAAGGRALPERGREVDGSRSGVTIIPQVTPLRLCQPRRTARPAPAGPGALPGDAEALDAYSRVVTYVAETLAPSVANLRINRRGGGSGVVITPDGFLLTSAHVVGRRARPRVRASFTDGRELSAEVVGADPLSDLALLRTGGRRRSCPPSSATPRRCASASSWSRSATRTASRAR